MMEANVFDLCEPSKSSFFDFEREDLEMFSDNLPALDRMNE
jgi:hypothetical protein